jgi:hypothetical protein
MKLQKLAALAVTLSTLLLASLFATPASATAYSHGGITCTQNTGSGLSPNVYTCFTGVPAQFKGGISGTQSIAISLLQPNSHFWEFLTYADFYAFCNNPTGPSLPCSTLPIGLVGVTLGNNSLIFVQGEPAPYGAAAGGHEEGHQLDTLFQGLLGQPASKSAEYLAKVNKDWTNFNAKLACTLNGTGAFDFRRDHNNAYICTGLTGAGGALTAAYAAGNNKSRLQKAWPYNFKPGDATHTANICATGAYCELWAEEQKRNLGDNDNTMAFASAIQFLMNGDFKCSLQFQSWLFTTGTLAPASLYPPECQ